MKKKWNKKKICLLAGGVVILGGAAILFGTVNAKKQGTQTNTVQSVMVEKGTIQSTVEGSGKLEFSNTVDVSVPSGVEIEELLVESGDVVKKGDTLAKLNKTSVTKLLVEVQSQLEDIDDEQSKSGLTTYEKEVLNAEEDELEQQEEELIQLRKNPVIVAEVSGIVASVNDSDSSESSSIQNNANVSQMSSDSSENQKLLYLTCDVTEKDTGEAEGEDDSQATELKTITFEDTKGKLNLEAPETGKTPQTSVSGDGYTGSVSWNCQGNFEALKEYTATIVLNAKDSYQFSDEYTPSVENASYRCNVNTSGTKMTIEAKFAVTKDNTSKTEEPSQNSSSQSSSKANVGSAAKQSGGSSAVSGGSTGTSSSDEIGDYESNETVIVSIAQNDEVQVSIEVDELDILSVEKGQKATVTLDALENQEFTGEITKVSNASTSSSSESSKYTVKISVPMDENMRIGMNAQATVCVEEAADVLTIPVLALQERRGESFVYTSTDEDGGLSGEVQVETGLSDGNTVEITSGLEEGTTVYYSRTESDSTSDQSGNPFGNMGNGFGGEMPSNMGKPDGQRGNGQGSPKGAMGGNE